MLNGRPFIFRHSIQNLNSSVCTLYIKHSQCAHFHPICFRDELFWNSSQVSLAVENYIKEL